MKLFYFPGACSLAVDIALREAGLPFELVRVDTKAGTTERGESFLEVNPKGYVPALQLDDGQVLTEVGAILPYVADLSPGAGLAPAAGTFERVRLDEWLNYLATEVHKTVSSLFNKSMPEEYRASRVDAARKALAFLARRLAAARWLLGERYTVADAYLFIVLRWTRYVGLDLAEWPALVDYQRRIQARPAVEAALRAEGLIRSPAA